MKNVYCLLAFILCYALPINSKQFTVSSQSFKNNESIPVKYTGDGQNVSPHLQWSNAPAGTKSFALFVQDPDAPEKVWVHWLLFNIPSIMHELPEGIKTGNFLSGVTDFYYTVNGIFQYGGPFPPKGSKHRYEFTIYALDTVLNLSSDAERDDVLIAMEGHILAQAQLIGVYKR
ncbi:MAG TPA: YbhB/YbcL family Raf kinase inhibitor-like protein [Candidatus Babeliales bacterium]|nr:YbhB/YbcL family Raf kinase inhibitor-like protein [Candidatus Babeliales bacterium]